MKQFLKRGLAILTAFILCLQFGKIDAQAANVVIALSASTVSVGNNVTATISVSGSDIPHTRSMCPTIRVCCNIIPQVEAPSSMAAAER